MRILVADDEKKLAEALAKILKKNNYVTEIAYDGEEALYRYECGEYDAIILDIMMPKKDGIEVLKEIRKKDKNTPILMLTAKNQVEDKVEGLDSGANDYLEKPFDTRELLARLRSITRNKNEVNNQVQFGNTFLDKKTFELITPTNRIKLTSKEYQILELLMQQPGNVVSSNQLIEKVWNDNIDTDINVVWVYVSYLRSKLKALSSNIEIKVSRSIGYYLEKKSD